ncbi:MAG: Rpn family recombination-promoting nuclease/putative transposase [Bacteroides sp.]|nr:Rpn family recombination-promoting nuclease/putative transposase [Eubacterium sp.]MCM1418514.1 Rpn family recombination-promoting nuclease/putative transposase [Roseburia sp.]MCM1462534.1 Rpn family recombination-promoting nuclease/putative transposase [Bacteroides sp.]
MCGVALSDQRELWLQFINADKEEDFEMLEQTNVPIMKKAVKVIYDMSEDAKMREVAWIREKALHDEASLLNGAREEGIEIGEARGEVRGRAKGREEGRAEERAAMAERMRADGVPESVIRKYIPE